MPTLPTARIRNVALVGHGGVGKTALAEALLRRAGAIPKTAPANESVLDHDPEEVDRKMSISLGIASFEWKSSDGETYRINLLDTPGYPDFVAERDAALAVADLAVVVVSAIDGVEVGTELAWDRAKELGVPRMVFVTREDKQRANFEQALAQLRATFGAGVTPLELPLGEEEAFHGVADLLTEQALEYAKDGSHHSAAMPSDLADHEHEVHNQIVEEIVSGDDDQLNRYLDGDVPTPAELERTLAHEMLDGVEFPVLVGSGLTGVGVDRLADFICELGPSPEDRPVAVIAGGAEVPVVANSSGDPLVYVFKTLADQFVGQISIFKVLSGTMKADITLTDSLGGAEERLHAPFRLVGAEHVACSEFVAGDIGAVAKLNQAQTGSTLAPKNKPVKVQRVSVAPPHHAVALKAVGRADEDKLPGALQRLVREDLALQVQHDEATHQTILRGVGDLHVTVALARLARKFGVNVTTGEVTVPYRLTISSKVETEGRVKKQSGGHGQFAVVNMRISPVPSGTGLDFVDAIVGGAIPKNYLAAVLHGVEAAMHEGDETGIPIVDVRVEAYDGKTHAVDSSEMAFKTAAALGFKEAVAKATPVILEPISTLHLTVPSDSQGAVLGDISGRRGKVVSSDSGGGKFSTITAEIPTAELGRYAMDLRAMTSGRGSYTVEHARYEAVPAHLTAQIRAKLAAAHAK